MFKTSVNACPLTSSFYRTQLNIRTNLPVPAEDYTADSMCLSLFVFMQLFSEVDRAVSASQNGTKTEFNAK